MTSPRWTSSDVADFLRVSPRTIADWCKAKKIPHRILNGLYRFVPEEIEAWTEERKVEVRA